MSDYKLGAVESRFADIIWTHEPLSSGELVKLCEKGFFRNEDGVVTSVISREEYDARQSEQFVEETFHGSLPAFLAAFTRRKSLSQQEIDELQRLIDESRR